MFINTIYVFKLKLNDEEKLRHKEIQVNDCKFKFKIE